MPWMRDVLIGIAALAMFGGLIYVIAAFERAEQLAKRTATTLTEGWYWIKHPIYGWEVRFYRGETVIDHGKWEYENGEGAWITNDLPKLRIEYPRD